jgi:hypothetical protein
MRWLVALVLALAVIWSGYWFVGARVIEAQADRQFAGAEARGVVAEREALAVRGFPNRFDLTVDGPRLLDPASGYGWEAPFLQIFALTWQPWHVIVAFPPDQVFTTPFGPARLTAAKMQASIRARPRASLPLEQLTLVGEGLGLTFAPLGPVSARELRFASRDRDGTGMTQEVGLEVLDLSPDPALLARLGDVPDLIERLRVDADLRFDRPIDRFAFATRPALTSLRLRRGSACPRRGPRAALTCGWPTGASCCRWRCRRGSCGPRPPGRWSVFWASLRCNRATPTPSRRRSPSAVAWSASAQ